MVSGSKRQEHASEDGQRGSKRGEKGDSDGTSGISKIQSRGIVTMVNVKKKRVKGEVIKVNWNEMGQPIGKESMTLAHFIGSCSRRIFPITITDWRNKDLTVLKDQFWDEVKETFVGVDKTRKKLILHRAGYLHRVFRTRLRNLAKDDQGNYSDKPSFIYSYMSTVSPFWKEFVAYSSTLDFKDTSKINKVRAESIEARYRKACVGYARLREQIIEEKLKKGEEDPVVTRLDTWKRARMNAEHQVDDPAALRILEDVVRITQELGEEELNDIGIEDLLDRVIPLEYSGGVRGYGFGVTKRSLSSIPNESELSKLRRQFNRLEKEIQEMKTNHPMTTSCGSSHMDNFSDDAMDSDGDVDVPAIELPEGPITCYLYVEKPRRHVGQGILHNGPKEILHGFPLPEGYVRIQFEVVVESEINSDVPQQTDEVRTVGEAVGQFISWPKKLVSLKIECPPLRKTDKRSKKIPTGANKPTSKTMESTFCVKPVGYPKSGDSPHDSMVLHLLRLAPQTITHNIKVPIEAYFDGETWDEFIIHENILEVLEDGWLSATSIAFYIRYLGDVHLSENAELAGKFSFLSPHVTPMVDSGTSCNHLAECLVKYAGQNHLLLMPHNVGHHWVLIAINTQTETIYFMDPLGNAKISQRVGLKNFVESGMRVYRTIRGNTISRVAYNKFKWSNIQCPKQIDGIHCGHYVCCFIEDILSFGDTTISILFVNKESLKHYSLERMENFKLNWAGYLYNRFLKEKMK